MKYKGRKGKAWDALRFYVYKRDLIKYKGQCFTCPAFPESFNRQAGHCFPVGYVGSNNTLSWDERQIRVQCGRCNGPGQGMQSIFKERLKSELGDEVVAELEARQHRVDPVKDWDGVIHNYENKLLALKKE